MAHLNRNQHCCSLCHCRPKTVVLLLVVLAYGGLVLLHGSGEIGGTALFLGSGCVRARPGVLGRQVSGMKCNAAGKVAFLQEQQIPRQQAEDIVKAQGFDVVWSLNEPSDAWAVVTVNAPVTAEVLDRHPNCKLVAVSFTGFNHVDIEACRKRGISVVNVPSYSTDAVAELSVGLALAVYRELPGCDRTLRSGGWVHSAGGMELRDKVIGVVGLGRIGMRAAELFQAFRPRELLGWSRRAKPKFSTEPLMGCHTSLEEIFERADVVSLHIALNSDTQGFVGRSLLERLRPEAVLINVARGGVLDQTAMCELLCQRRFRAGLDVFEAEPIPADDPILQVPADQVVLTPHVAYKSLEALQRRMLITSANLRAFHDGSPTNIVS